VEQYSLLNVEFDSPFSHMTKNRNGPEDVSSDHVGIVACSIAWMSIKKTTGRREGGKEEEFRDK
jgi:hypothetical protein